MKRDMELIKKILLKLESTSTFCDENLLEIDGYSDIEMSYHLKLANEAGLIEVREIPSNPNPLYLPKSLTWEGHEFLEASKNPTVWNNALKKIKDKSSGMSFDILKGLLLQETLHLVGLK